MDVERLRHSEAVNIATTLNIPRVLHPQDVYDCRRNPFEVYLFEDIEGGVDIIREFRSSFLDMVDWEFPAPKEKEPDYILIPQFCPSLIPRSNIKIFNPYRK